MPDLLELEAENVLSLGKITLSLEKRGLVRIEGRNLDATGANDNGAGKSSISEAITWCLYGCLLRSGVDNDRVIREGQKSCHSSVRMRVEQDHYRITRERSKGKTKLSLHHEETDQNLSCLDIADTQKRIDALIGMDFTTFCNAVIYDRTELNRFTAAADSDRKRLLEALLGVDVYERCHAVAKSRLAAVDQQHMLAQSTGTMNEEAIKQARATIQDVRGKAAQWEEQKAAELAALDQQLAGYKTQSAQIAKLDAQRQGLRAQQAQLNNDRLAQQQEAAQKIQELQAPVSKLAYELSAIKEELQQLDGLGGTCSYCFQAITDEHKAQHREKLDARVATLEPQATKAKAALQKARTESDKQSAKFQQDILKVQKDIDAAEAEYRQVHAQVTALERLKVQRQQVEKRQSPYAVAEETAKKQLVGYLAKRDEIGAELTALSEQRDLLQFWVTAYGRGGIRSYLLDEVVPRLNERAADVAAKLTGGDLELQFSTTTKLKSGADSDKFNLTVKNRHGAQIYGGNSEGEKRRADLCVLFALHELARSRVGKINLLILDEIFDVIDDAGVEYISEFLASIVGHDGIESCFVITHNSALAPMIPQRLVLEKHHGVTQLLEG